ncbi:MAG: cupin domain-containing protein [Candidatus Eremiobacteraeota bacterium]|nr:cupin domain-containing protein [Candidatus Eremiobacteraeota bacterium]
MMRKALSSIAAFFLFTIGIAAAAPAPAIYTPDKITWVAGPMAGTQMAVLAGDPTKPGPYTFRLKLAPNTTFGPHFHADTESVTVISGSLWVGLGDQIDQSKLMQLPAGSYVTVPQGIHHYALTKEETVLQLNGMGPFTMTAVKP